MKEDSNVTMNPVQPSISWILKSPHRFLAFGFGSGLIRPAPGTWGTLLALLLWFPLSLWSGTNQSRTKTEEKGIDCAIVAVEMANLVSYLTPEYEIGDDDDDFGDDDNDDFDEDDIDEEDEK